MLMCLQICRNFWQQSGQVLLYLCSIRLTSVSVEGFRIGTAYSRIGQTSLKYAFSLTTLSQGFRVMRTKKLRTLFTVLETLDKEHPVQRFGAAQSSPGSQAQ